MKMTISIDNEPVGVIEGDTKLDLSVAVGRILRARGVPLELGQVIRYVPLDAEAVEFLGES